MKKLISVVLAGAVIMGVCACNKSDSPKKTRDTDTAVEEAEEEDDEDETEAEETAAENVAHIFEDDYWFIDPTDEATMKELVDDLIACEPKLGDHVGEPEDVGKRVGTTFGKKFNEYSLYSYGHQFNFVYGSENMTDVINERDHVRYVAYSNYDLESVGRLEFDVTGYDKVYTHKDRPGTGSVVLYVYDEDRAKAARAIWAGYVSELYKDEIVEVTESSSGNIRCRYGEAVNDTIADVNVDQLKDNNSNPINCWRVELFITFDTENMFKAEC